jgi:glycerophosphoryl diester phosphodiesterase
MEAFRAAAELGVDQIETDVRVTKDGELVLIHDATVDRTTNGTGRVIDMTLAELKALDAGIRKDEKFKGCRIPTLIELMEYVKDHPTLTLDLELKEYPDGDHEAVAFDVCDRVLEIVDRYGFTDRVVINSFSGKLNEYVHQKHEKKYRQHVFFPIDCLGKCTIDPYAYAYCCCMFSNCGEPMATVEEMELMQARGVEPWAGAAVKDEATVDMMIERGAVLVTCNNPDVILKLLREKGKRAYENG